MCTYLTEHVQIDGSGKGATGWFGADRATVYVDHPVHAPYGHTVNIDLLNPALGASARVALGGNTAFIGGQLILCVAMPPDQPRHGRHRAAHTDGYDNLHQ